MPKTIMVIDDEKEVLEEMEAWLGDQGYNVMTAKNADEGLRKLNSNSAHLLLLDINMPKKDGLAILSELKRNIKTEAIPVIMLTARVETSSILEAMEMKACDYVTKPFNEDELLRLIRRYEI
jgi:DNA-binding response OmpR family regulator